MLSIVPMSTCCVLILSSSLFAQAVGSHICQPCHSKIYQQWSHSVHAESFKSIPIHQQRNPYCLACHLDPMPTLLEPIDLQSIPHMNTTPSTQHTSTAEHSFAASVDLTSTPSMFQNHNQSYTRELQKGVSCEACHGYAYRYIQQGIKHKWQALLQNHKLSPSKKQKQLKAMKKQAYRLGLKSGKDQVICMRCHTALSTKIIPKHYQKKLFQPHPKIHSIAPNDKGLYDP